MTTGRVERLVPAHSFRPRLARLAQAAATWGVLTWFVSMLLREGGSGWGELVGFVGVLAGVLWWVRGDGGDVSREIQAKVGDGKPEEK
jgi:hypothetical protein